MGGAIRIVRVPGWERFDWLRHGFSTRAGGVSQVYGRDELNLGMTREDDPALVGENRRRMVEAVAGKAVAGKVDTGEVDALRLATVRQVHGVVVKRIEGPQGAIENASADGVADGMVTSAAGVMLGISVADCVPVLLADTRLRVVAAVHAGWRGTVAGIAGAAIGRMREEFGSRAGDLVGAVGPSIRGCCYAVGDEVQGEFGRAFADAAALFRTRDGAVYLDLAEANRRQMLAAGLAEDAISVLGECTGCARVEGRRKYFSHRMEAGFTGRGMGMIGMVQAK